MGINIFNMNVLIGFLLVLFRIGGMMVSAPFFDQKGVPGQVKVALALGLAVMLFPIYGMHVNVPINNFWLLMFHAGQETAIGLLIGFVGALIFAAIEMAGSHLALQMGLSMASALDPVSNQESPVIGQLYSYLGMLLFLALNVHHQLIWAVAKSFEMIPVAHGFFASNDLAHKMMGFGQDIFGLSMVLVLPVLGILLVQELALAFVSKIMPQMNVFMVAMPIKILAGLVLIYVTLPYTMSAMENSFSSLTYELSHVYDFGKGKH